MHLHSCRIRKFYLHGKSGKNDGSDEETRSEDTGSGIPTMLGALLSIRAFPSLISTDHDPLSSFVGMAETHGIFFFAVLIIPFSQTTAVVVSIVFIMSADMAIVLLFITFSQETMIVAVIGRLREILEGLA